jgi:RNA polymerase sigma-70 factor (ECF subfamily)
MSLDAGPRGATARAQMDTRMEAGAAGGKPADAPAIDTLYAHELPRLTRFFKARTGRSEDAADLAQDTFLRFLRAAPGTAILAPQAYLRRIAGNLLRDRAASTAERLARRALPIEDGHGVADCADPHRLLEARGELEHYWGVLQKLKPKTLEIFILHRVDGLTYKEIGARLGLSEGGVKRHMVKAIAHILRARRAR